MKPGITGLWQVSGRSRLSMRAALELDVEYTRRRSVLLDLSISGPDGASALPGRRELMAGNLPGAVRSPSPAVPT